MGKYGCGCGCGGASGGCGGTAGLGMPGYAIASSMPNDMNGGANFRMPFDQRPVVAVGGFGGYGGWSGWGGFSNYAGAVLGSALGDAAVGAFGGLSGIYGLFGSASKKCAALKKKITEAHKKHKSAKHIAKLTAKMHKKCSKAKAKARKKAGAQGGNLKEVLAYDPNAGPGDEGLGPDGAGDGGMALDGGDGGGPMGVSWAWWIGGSLLALLFAGMAMKSKGGE